jgi:hypothetical protein
MRLVRVVSLMLTKSLEHNLTDSHQTHPFMLRLQT